MQNPEPWPGNAWCVPPAVLQARPRSSASSAVSSVPACIEKGICSALDPAIHYRTNDSVGWVDFVLVSSGEHMMRYLADLVQSYVSAGGWHSVSTQLPNSGACKMTMRQMRFKEAAHLPPPPGSAPPAPAHAPRRRSRCASPRRRRGGRRRTPTRTPPREPAPQVVSEY